MDRLKNLPHPTLANPIGDLVGAERQLAAADAELLHLVRGEDGRLDQVLCDLVHVIADIADCRLPAVAHDQTAP